MADLSERQICDQMWKWRREGAKARIACAPCPYPANTIAYFMHCEGWLCEDLRQALMKADPRYGDEQRRLEAAGVFS